MDALPEELANLFRQLEVTLLEEIAKRLIIADNLNEATMQDIRALRAHGISVSEIRKAIKKTAKIGDKKLNSLFSDVIERNKEYYTDLCDIAQITAPQMLVDKSVIEAIIRQANEEYRNITRSMAFLVDAGRTMLPPAKAYEWALDNALMQVQSGAINYNQAIARATQQLADSGLTVAQYESGHRDQIDVAVRRAVMTGVNQVNSQYADQSMDYLDAEYVEVSAHAGARDKDGPLGWENHKAWQGKVYWWKEKSKGNPKLKVPEFVETCGLGSVTGILGANCRHNYSPFIPGVMERTYTDEQLKNIDPPDFVYEGKKYTHYEATQQQRAIERAVRKWKRREAAATNPKDKQAAQIRIRLLKQKYQEFSKAANLRMQPERMRNYIDDKVVVSNTPKESKNAAFGYRDVTSDWYANTLPKQKPKNLRVFEQDGVRYRVDGINVKLEVSGDDKRAAALLERELGGELYHVPKVQGSYSGVKTPDFLFRGKRFDLKTPDGVNEKHETFYNMIHGKRLQADNFILDISRCGMTTKEAIAEIDGLYKSKHTAFVKTLMLVKDDQILSIFERK